MSKVNEQLSKLASLFALAICHSLNILHAHFVESGVDFGMQSFNSLLSSSAAYVLFAGRKKTFWRVHLPNQTANRLALEKSCETPVFVPIAAYINSKIIFWHIEQYIPNLC